MIERVCMFCAVCVVQFFIIVLAFSVFVYMELIPHIIGRINECTDKR